MSVGLVEGTTRGKQKEFHTVFGNVAVELSRALIFYARDQDPCFRRHSLA